MSPVRAAALALALLAGAPAHAGMAELTFWTAVRDSRNPAELQAYLDAFPNGTFAELARIRIAALTAAPAAPARAPAEAAPAASIAADRAEFAAVERIPVTVDATALRNYTNLAVVAAPAGMPDAMLPELIAALGVRVGTGYVRLTLPPVSGGEYEARLYAIAPYETAPKVVARTTFAVTPAPGGAVLVEDLARDARSRGAIGFEAAYRDTTLRVAGQFLEATAGVDAPNWIEVLAGDRAGGTNYVVLMLGHLGDPAPEQKRNRVACIVGADDGDVLRRIAAMSPGDEVVVEGRGSTWGKVSGHELVTLDPCRILG